MFHIKKSLLTYCKKKRLDGRIFLMRLPEQFLAVLNQIVDFVFTDRRVLGQRRQVLRNQNDDDIGGELGQRETAGRRAWWPDFRGMVERATRLVAGMCWGLKGSWLDTSYRDTWGYIWLLVVSWRYCNFVQAIYIGNITYVRMKVFSGIESNPPACCII